MKKATVALTAALLILTGCSSTDTAEQPPAGTVEQSTAAPIASAVEAELKTAWAVENFSDGLTDPSKDPTQLNWYIADIEDGATGTVHVTVQVTQDEVTPEALKQLSLNILNLTGIAIKDLDWVVVKTADGNVTEQSQRSESPLL